MRQHVDQSERAHVTPLLIELHWPLMADRIKFMSLMLAYRVTSGSAPIYLNSIIQAYRPSWATALSGIATQGNLSPECSRLWFPNGGTSYQILSEQWRSSPFSKSVLISSSFPNTLTCLTHTYCAVLSLDSLHFVLLNRFSS